MPIILTFISQFFHDSFLLHANKFVIFGISQFLYHSIQVNNFNNNFLLVFCMYLYTSELNIIHWLKYFCYLANVSDSMLHIQKTQSEVNAEDINVTFNDVKGVCAMFAFI